MVPQGLLFSEPSVAETGVWCDLSEGMDPAEWASLLVFVNILKYNDKLSIDNFHITNLWMQYE